MRGTLQFGIATTRTHHEQLVMGRPEHMRMRALPPTSPQASTPTPAPAKSPPDDDAAFQAGYAAALRPQVAKAVEDLFEKMKREDPERYFDVVNPVKASVDVDDREDLAEKAIWLAGETGWPFDRCVDYVARIEE